MRQELLNYLWCTKCEKDFELSIYYEAEKDIRNGILVCKQCERCYNIVSGVPRFAGSTKNVKGFEFEWKNIETYKEGGFGNYTKGMRDDEAFEQEFFSQITPPLYKQSFEGDTVLDAGCGNGQNSIIMSRYGAKVVIGADLSDAVDVAHIKTVDNPNIHIIQADISNLPLKPVFDKVVSVGVLMHTERPRNNFRKLTALLKSGGSISAMLYGREGTAFAYNVITPVRLKITSKMPPALLKPLAWLPSLFFYAALRLNIPVVHKSYMQYARTFTLKRIYLHVFDQLTPRIARHYSEAGARLFTKGLRGVLVTQRYGSTWRIHGKK